MIEGNTIYKNYAVNYLYKERGLGIFLIIRIFDLYKEDNKKEHLYEIEFPVAYKNKLTENIDYDMLFSDEDILILVESYFIYKDMFNTNKYIDINNKVYEYCLVKNKDYSTEISNHNVIELRFREKSSKSNEISSFVEGFIGASEDDWSIIKLGSYTCSNEYLNGEGTTTEYLLISDIVKLSNVEEVENLIREHIETNEIYDGYLSESLI